MDTFFRPIHESGLTVLHEGTIEILPSGEFRIDGFSVSGSFADDLLWLAVGRARKAIEKVQREHPRNAERETIRMARELQPGDVLAETGRMVSEIHRRHEEGLVEVQCTDGMLKLMPEVAWIKVVRK